MSDGFTPYDDAWRTLINDVPMTLIPLINEMFKQKGIYLTGKEELNFSANEIFLNRQDGMSSKRITDSSFTVNDGKSVKRFHIECQSTTDGSMIIRMFEYDSQIALNDARNNWENGNLYVRFPDSGILYLRATSNTPDYVTTTIEVPSGESVSYDIPTLKISDYSAEEIVNKKLYFLIPFFFFNFEKHFKLIEEGDESIKREVNRQLNIFVDALNTAQANGELREIELIAIAGMFKKVMRNLTIGHDKIREEVLDNMGGTILDYPEKTAYRDGMKDAIEQYISSEMKNGLSRAEAEAKAATIFTVNDGIYNK